MEVLASFGDGVFVRMIIWFVIGFSFGYFVPAPKFISDRLGKKK